MTFFLVFALEVSGGAHTASHALVHNASGREINPIQILDAYQRIGVRGWIADPDHWQRIILSMEIAVLYGYAPKLTKRVGDFSRKVGRIESQEGEMDPIPDELIEEADYLIRAVIAESVQSRLFRSDWPEYSIRHRHR